MKKIYIITVFCLFAIVSLAQDQPVANQYLLNKFFYNPAFVGSSKNAIIVKLTDRHQWTGLEDAPATQTLSAQGRIGKSHGVGISIMNDKNGANSNRGIQIAYAYMIRLAKIRSLMKAGDYTEPMISFGISANGNQMTLDETKFDNFNENPIYYTQDPLYTGTIEKAFIPNANAGVYFYSPMLYAGISANQLLPNNVKIYDKNYEPKSKTFFYTNFGLSFGESTTMYQWGFEPSIMFKMSTENERQFDINFKVRYMRTFWTAVSYRRNLDAGGGSNISSLFLVGVDFHQYRFAYVYDHSFSHLRSFSMGTHEIMLGFLLSNEVLGAKY